MLMATRQVTIQTVVPILNPFFSYFQGDHHGPINESEAQDAHDRAYNQGGAGNLSASGMGTAAALQVSFDLISFLI